MLVRPTEPTLEFDLDQAVSQARLFTEVTGVPCVLIHHSGEVLHPATPEAYPCRLCRMVSARDAEDRRETHPHWRWVEESARFGGRYVWLCENTFTHWTAPLLRGGRLVAGLIAGPVLMVQDADFFDSELLTRYDESHRSSTRVGARGGGPEWRKTAEAIGRLRALFEAVPRLEPERVTIYSQLLYQLSLPLSQDRMGAMEESALALEQQSRINEYVQELKLRRSKAGADPETPSYPIEKERLLLEHIRSGSVNAAQKVLNELLGHVFFSSGQDVPSLKLKAREIIVVLSRAVVSEGADPEEVFGLNFQFVEAIDSQTDENGIIYWMARIVRRFADLILYMPNVAHGRVLRRAVAIVRRRLAEPLRVADIAEAVGLSADYFSRVFHQEMGETFVAYIRRVRVEHATHLLRTTTMSLIEIAAEAGFSDHSYFTRVFRETMGTTPSRYRETVR